MNTNLILFRTVFFQLSRSIGQIMDSEKGVPVVNALVLGNYRRKTLLKTTLLSHAVWAQLQPV